MSVSNPKVTVLMPVFNGEKFLKETIQSILNQTFTDFELLIIDDYSNDHTFDVVNSFKDNRIVYVKNEKNLGVSSSSNIGIRLAKGEYIARTDCDDISYPKRLEKQIKFLEKNKNVSICGTWAESFGLRNKILKPPVTNEEIACQLLFNSAFIHSSVIFRKDIFLNDQFYYSTFYNTAEDYELWGKIFQNVQMVNIPKVLVKYRMHLNSASSCQGVVQQDLANKVRLHLLDRCGFDVTQNEHDLHQKISQGNYIDSYDFVKDSQSWFMKILKENLTRKIYDQFALEEDLSLRFFSICLETRSLGWGKGLQVFIKSRLSRSFHKAFVKRLKYNLLNILTI